MAPDQIGGCYNESTMPPGSSGSDNYVLCCVDSARGTGRHCLRFDYSVPYFLSVDVKRRPADWYRRYDCVRGVQSVINVTIVANGAGSDAFGTKFTDHHCRQRGSPVLGAEYV